MRRPPIPPQFGGPDVHPGGRAVRSIAATFAVAATMIGAVVFEWMPDIEAHAQDHPERCIDVPIAQSNVITCGGRRDVVRVHVVPGEDGGAAEFRVRGRRYDMADLRRHLRALGNDGREKGVFARFDVVIRAERHVPWGQMQPLLGAIADANQDRVQFVVRPPGSRPCRFDRPPADDPITSQLKEQLR